MSGSAFFFLRLNDHIQYLRRVQATLDGKDDFTGTCHTACKLGRWLYGPGPEQAAACGPEAVRVFDELFEPHEEFHRVSHEALTLKQAGDEERAAQAVTRMHQLSTLLVNRLIELDGLASRCEQNRERSPEQEAPPATTPAEPEPA